METFVHINPSSPLIPFERDHTRLYLPESLSGITVVNTRQYHARILLAYLLILVLSGPHSSSIQVTSRNRIFTMAEIREKAENADLEIIEHVQSNIAEVSFQSSNIRAIFICLFAMSGALLFGIDNGLAIENAPKFNS